MLRELVLGTVLAGVLAAAADPPEYTHAMDLVRMQRWDEALAQIAVVLQHYPDNLKAMNLQGLALAGSGKGTQARAVFEHVLNIDPRFAPSLKNLAILEWGLGDRRAAATHTHGALQLLPRDPVLNAYAALAAADAGDISAMLEALAAAGLARSVLPARAQADIAVLLAKSGKYAEAEPIFAELFDAQSGRKMELRYNLALVRFRLGKYAECIRTLETAPATRLPSDSLNLLAQAYEKVGQAQKAIDTYREATRLYPRDENNYLDLANLCLDHNAVSLAEEVIRVGLTYRPQSAKLFVEMGVIDAIAGRYDGAQRYFAQAAAIEPANDLPAAAMSIATMQQSRLTEAANELRAQLKAHPRSGMLWYLLGVALQRAAPAGENAPDPEAMRAFRNAVRFDPGIPYPDIELGKESLRAGRVNDAIGYFETAAKLAPSARAPYYHLAIAYRMAGDKTRAAAMLAKVKDMLRGERQDAAAPVAVQQP